MPELRWTLLILGALFVVGLALWELRRQRQAPRQGVSPSASSGAERVSPGLENVADGGGRGHREPTISFPELHPEPRTTAPDPKVVELDAESFSRLPVEGVTGSELVGADDVTSELAPLRIDPSAEDFSDISDAARVAADEALSTPAAAKGGHSTSAPNTAFGSLQAAAPAAAKGGHSPAATAGNSSLEADAADSGAPAPDNSYASQSTGFVSDADEPEHTPSQMSQPPAGATAAGAPIVDWPGEDNRKILALRLVSAPAARFQGRAVRQALAAEGFVLGKFDIFHKPGPDDRAVLSAASLTKPGTFTMNTIDAQRYGGISLFAVLPGPLSAQETFDELLTTAKSLNDRLQGALQDERGEPLTPTRSANIRQSLAPAGEEGSGTSGSVPPASPRHH